MLIGCSIFKDQKHFNKNTHNIKRTKNKKNKTKKNAKGEKERKKIEKQNGKFTVCFAYSVLSKSVSVVIYNEPAQSFNNN